MALPRLHHRSALHPPLRPPHRQPVLLAGGQWHLLRIGRGTRQHSMPPMAKGGGRGHPLANYAGCDFRPGRRFESEVIHRFGTPPLLITSWLVLSPCGFYRSSFRPVLRRNRWAWPSTLFLVDHPEDFILAVSSHVTFASPLPQRRLVP
jgi:hypothetical protein